MHGPNHRNIQENQTNRFRDLVVGIRVKKRPEKSGGLFFTHPLGGVNTLLVEVNISLSERYQSQSLGLKFQDQ